MTSKGYVNDLFRQFEKVNEKLDKANDTISRLSFTIFLDYHLQYLYKQMR